MNPREQLDLWAVAGSFGAIALGFVMIPLRTMTSASNLAFAFLAWTIVVAEVGGRRAALVKAIVSAMSLNFFLTEPYGTLMISKTDDVIAFGGWRRADSSPPHSALGGPAGRRRPGGRTVSWAC